MHISAVALPDGVKPTIARNFTICSIAPPTVMIVEEEAKVEAEGEVGAEDETEDEAKTGDTAKAKTSDAEKK